MKKKILLMLGVAAVTTISVGTTFAHLSSETETLVDVYELGNVSIKHLQYERVVDDDGKWVSTGEIDKYGYVPDKLQEYTQDKALFPAVFADGDIKWDDRNGSEKASGEGSYQQSWGQIGASGANQLFDESVRNVIDKFVFVENDGKNNAYVRTWFAFEQGDIAAKDFFDVIEINHNLTQWDWVNENDLEDEKDDELIIIPDVEITDSDGNTGKYLVMVATYKGPASNPNGVLEAGKISYPSLLQVYMKPAATNEDVKAIDGNGNGKYDILVVSQAVQTVGFDNAEMALTAGYGELTADNHPFFRKSSEN